MKRTLLIVVGDLDVGGTAQHLTQVLPRLNRDGFQVLVYALTHKGVLAPKLEAAGVPVLEPWGGSVVQRLLPRAVGYALLLPLTAVRLTLLMRRRKPDIAHFFLPMAYLVGGLCALVARVPCRVMSRRNLATYQLKHPLLARLERRLHRHVRMAVGNSKAVVAQLRLEGIPEEKLGLIYNGLDLSAVATATKKATRKALLSAYRIGEETLVLILVANLIYYKGHTGLLRALGRVREQLPREWALLCVGRDDGIGEALAEVARENRLARHVHWLGPRSDVAALLALSDIGLLCSDQEGFSNSLLESMAAGLPMVVTNVGGNAEAVVDGETGFVVPQQDAGRLGGAILRLAGDAALRRRMGQAGQARVARRFTLEACAQAYAGLYERLLADGVAPSRARATRGRPS